MIVLDDLSAVTSRARVRMIPGIELCLAIWAATSPEREPLSRVACRIQAAMPLSARNELQTLNRTLPTWPLYMIDCFYRLNLDDLDESLRRLASEPLRAIASELLDDRRSGAALGFDWTSHSSLSFPQGERLTRETARWTKVLVSRPEETLLQILDVLRSFAEAGFDQVCALQRDTWTKVSESLAQQLAQDPQRALSHLSPRAVLDTTVDRLTFMVAQEDRVLSCKHLTGFDLIPSMWLRRRVVLTRAPGRIGVVVGRGPTLRNELRDGRMPAMLAALGDERRFEILLLCLERPHTTSELAPMLGITEGPVSRHLKELERDGLVVGQRSGRYVRYATAVEVLQLLGQRLQGLPQRVWTEEPNVRHGRFHSRTELRTDALLTP